MKGNLHIRGSPIPFSDEVLYLGITMNGRLNWNTHVINKIKKSKGKLCMLRSALGVKWGPSPKMLLWAYESLIVPSLTYGAMIWGQTTLNTGTLNKLGQLNRLAAIMTSPIRKSTPSAGLEVILGLKPLDLIVQEFGMTDSLRWRPRIRWDGIGQGRMRGHVWAWERRSRDLGLDGAPVDRSGLRCFNWDPPCSTMNSFTGNREDFLICTVQTEQVGIYAEFTLP